MHLMAVHEDAKEKEISKTRLGRWRVMVCIGWSVLSLVGGVMLSWWVVMYEATNQQQWMVPLGLILFLTPLFVWFSVFVSDFCNSSPENPGQQPVFSHLSHVNKHGA